MAWLYIMVADGDGIILQIVNNLCSNIGICGIDKVGKVTNWLALKDVSIVKKQQVTAIFTTQARNVAAYSGQRTCLRFAVNGIVWEERAVHITGLKYSQFDGFVTC